MSDYYYGQGRVYLAQRNDTGQPLAWRWVGDVSSLEINIEFDEKIIKASTGGRLVTAARYITSVTGSLAATWHEYSKDNLSILLGAKATEQNPELIYSELLPTGISTGDRITLKNPNVWGVSIDGLTEGTDYSLDAFWGAITFKTTPDKQPLTVEYERAGNAVISVMEDFTKELAFRYEGEDLAEDNKPVLVEIYRLSFDPVDALALINSDSTLSELNTKATMINDPAKFGDPIMGQTGRIIVFERISGLLHDGAFNHDGIIQHKG